MIATLDAHIVQVPGVVGGKPYIQGRRITVQQIAVWHELGGQSADEIALNFELSLAEIHAALAYYFDHQHEIDLRSREDEAFVSILKQTIPSKLPTITL